MTNKKACDIINSVADSGNANGGLAQLGEHLPYKQRVTGSSPVVSTKKYSFFGTSIFLSKPQAWHIIAARSAVHIIKVGKPTLYLITRQRAFPCGLMRCNTSC